MDPLLLEALRFGLAILAGGIVAVIAQQLAFRGAERTAQRDHARRDRALLRALRWELLENMGALGEAGQRDLWPGVRRTAWDAARGLLLTDEFLAAVAAAYSIGDAYLEQVERVRLVAVGELRGPDLQNERAETIKRAKAAQTRFLEAVGVLEKRDPFVTA
jgi:hypothetical protein